MTPKEKFIQQNTHYSLSTTKNVFLEVLELPVEEDITVYMKQIQDLIDKYKNDVVFLDYIDEDGDIRVYKVVPLTEKEINEYSEMHLYHLEKSFEKIETAVRLSNEGKKLTELQQDYVDYYNSTLTTKE